MSNYNINDRIHCYRLVIWGGEIKINKLSASTNHKGYIDSLKGLFILGVLIAHTNGFIVLSNAIGVPLFTGGQSVFMLLLISCMLIFVSLRNSRSNTSWWTKKFIRIAPLYYPILLISIFVGGNTYWLGKVGRITIPNIFTHLTFLFDFYPSHANSIIGVEWYLGVLVIFYVISPVIFKKLDSFEKAVSAFFVVTPIVVILSHFACNAVSSSEDSELLTHYFSTYFFVNQLPVLLLGLVLYYVLESDIFHKFIGNKTLAYSLLFFSMVLFAGEILIKNNIFCFNASISYGIVFFFLLLSQAIYPCPLICNRFFSFLGKYSYAIYLLHTLIIMAVTKLLPTGTMSEIKYWLTEFAIVFIITTALSVAVTKLYVNPVTAKLKKILEK